jgi:hypothetical protein
MARPARRRRPCRFPNRGCRTPTCFARPPARRVPLFPVRSPPVGVRCGADRSRSGPHPRGASPSSCVLAGRIRWRKREPSSSQRGIAPVHPEHHAVRPVRRLHGLRIGTVSGMTRRSAARISTCSSAAWSLHLSRGRGAWTASGLRKRGAPGTGLADTAISEHRRSQFTSRDQKARRCSGRTRWRRRGGTGAPGDGTRAADPACLAETGPDGRRRSRTGGAARRSMNSGETTRHRVAIDMRVMPDSPRARGPDGYGQAGTGNGPRVRLPLTT